MQQLFGTNTVFGILNFEIIDVDILISFKNSIGTVSVTLY